MAPHHLESIKVCSDMAAIHSFEFTYSDHNGKKHTAGPWGGYGGNNVHMVSMNIYQAKCISLMHFTHSYVFEQIFERTYLNKLTDLGKLRFNLALQSFLWRFLEHLVDLLDFKIS